MNDKQLFIQEVISKIMSNAKSFTLEDVIFEMSTAIKNIDYYELEVLKALETLVIENGLNCYIIDDVVYYTTHPIVKTNKEFIGNYIYNYLLNKNVTIGYDNRNGSTKFINNITPISVSILGDMYGFDISEKEIKISLKRIRILFADGIFYITK